MDGDRLDVRSTTISAPGPAADLGLGLGGHLEEALGEAARRRRGQPDFDVTGAGRAEPRAVRLEPRSRHWWSRRRSQWTCRSCIASEASRPSGWSTKSASSQDVSLAAARQRRSRFEGWSSSSTMTRSARAGGGVARRAARFAEPLAELGGGRRPLVAERPEQPRPERMGDGAQRLDLGDPGAIPCVHGHRLTAKTSLHKSLCKIVFAVRGPQAERRSAPRRQARHSAASAASVAEVARPR